MNPGRHTSLTKLTQKEVSAAADRHEMLYSGRLGGAHKTTAELIVFGAKTGGFYFMVWAPGAALVREFWRAGRARGSAETPPR